MSEGPLNFGKPLFYLVLLGCAGGGFYLYKNWPVAIDGPGWSADMPNKWQSNGTKDDNGVPRTSISGPLPEETSGNGEISIHLHGTVNWPEQPLKLLPVTPDWTDDVEVDHKRALQYTFTEGLNRYRGVVVDRNDAYVVYWIGCPTPSFDANRKKFDKMVNSLKVMR